MRTITTQQDLDAGLAAGEREFQIVGDGKFTLDRDFQRLERKRGR